VPHVGVSPSITKVLDCLFLGGRRDAEALSSANTHQIATVITLCEEPVGRRNPAIRYLHFPVRDARPIHISWLIAILIAIGESVPRGAVLVHCGIGVSRAPTVVAAYLDRIGFLGFSEALHYLENLRPAIAPSPVLVRTIARELR
jgi:protein-tyrosine phosphatase